MLDSSSSVWVAGDEVHGEERSVVDARGEAVGVHDVARGGLPVHDHRGAVVEQRQGLGVQHRHHQVPGLA
ncbi:hypothetical protein [Streptomyces olivochromogenes]|uniref:hypothetical protein n=1 Tax=Streptomyces olivochromogenes TaxID=1963 RepID=UPI001F2EB6D4|nr:hypothetical protein [Streptomyces olivochromogenes]MCF3134053.1 hypothetical protein [Streptomyces olivochromogenes]